MLVAVIQHCILFVVVKNHITERKEMLNIMNARTAKKNVKWNGWKMSSLIIATNGLDIGEEAVPESSIELINFKLYTNVQKN